MTRRSILTVVLLAVGFAAVLAATAIQRERTYQGLLARGTNALRHHDAAVAIEALSGAIALKRSSMVAYLRRGEAYLLGGPQGFPSALRDFREAARLDRGAVRPLERLGDISTKLGSHERAAEYYRTGLELDAGAPAMTYKLALATYQAGRLADALELAQRASRLDPRLAEAHYLRGLCLVDQKRLREGSEAFRRALAGDASLVEARAQLALTARQLGRGGEEVTQLEQLAEQTQQPEYAVELGRALTRLGRIDQAIEVLDKASTRFPRDTKVMTTLGSAWLEKAAATEDGRARTQALAWLERAEADERRTGRETSDTLAALGRAWLLGDNPRQAVEVLQRAVATPPASVTAFDDLGRAAEQLSDWSLARTALERAQALDPTTRPDGRAARAAHLADLSTRLSDHEAAAAWLDEARHLRPNDMSLVARAVEAHWAAGHRDEAVRMLYAALAKEPEDAALRRLASRMQE
ncbi:MAG: tetratricopeptide repeat protein [Luteitalea sp.]|nr:tetratricopeptide repeat protein [Luteitalea sp.]